jgi:catechol 2,3-dioxygenase-like lactoylglutathione lyase family enzyme
MTYALAVGLSDSGAMLSWCPDATSKGGGMTATTGSNAWPIGIGAITLFVEDLAAARRFYEEVFGLPVVYEDENSAVFRFGETLINLLRASEAPSLVAPANVAPVEAGVRHQFTLAVENVDEMCDELKRRGVELLNGPMNRPWGIRTASFRDPGGHIWEIAK